MAVPLADEELPEILHRLPLPDREVLAARFLFELEYPEIARALGCSVRAARMRCQRARERLRSVMLRGDEEETRGLLRRATSMLAAGLLGEDFVQRVLREVKPLPSPTPPATGLPRPSLLHFPAMPCWLPSVGYKVLAGLTAFTLLACVHFAPGMPASNAVASMAGMNEPATISEAASNPPPAPVLGNPTRRRILAAAMSSAAPKAAPPESSIVPVPAPQTGDAGVVPPTTMALQMVSGFLIRSLAVSPDGKHLAASYFDHTVSIWDLVNDSLLASLPGIGASNAAFNQDGRRLLIAGDEGKPPLVWDLFAGSAVALPKALTGPGRFTTDGRKYWEHREDNEQQASLRLWNIDDGKLERTLPGITGDLLDISRDNTRAVTVTGVSATGEAQAGANAEYIIWDLTTGQALARMPGVAGMPAKAARLSPDGRTLAAAGSDTATQDVLLWDTQTGAQVKTFSGLTDHVNALAFSADGTQLAAAGQDGQVTVWEVAGGSTLSSFQQQNELVKSVAFIAGGQQLVTASRVVGNTMCPLRVWDIQGGTFIRELTGGLAQPVVNPDCAITADGALFAVKCRNHLQLCDLAHGCRISDLPLPNDTYLSTVAFSPDGALLLAALYRSNNTSMLMEWDTKTGELQKTVANFAGVITQAAFSPDGAHLVTCSAHGLVLWSTGNMSQEKRMAENAGEDDEVAFTPDGMKVVWLSMTTETDDNELRPTGGQLHIWNIPDGKYIVREAGDGNCFSDLALSPDGKWLVMTRGNSYQTYSGTPSQILLCDASSGEVRRNLPLPATSIYQGNFFFTPDNTKLIGST